MNTANIKKAVESGETYLGIELGSTRIKAVLIDKEHNVIASGGHGWENKLVDGMWSYNLDDVWEGLQDCYQNLATDVKNKYGAVLQKVGTIGFSAMMHGYMAFDKQDNLLVPFRTWRNTTTEQAAADLTEKFGFNIPQRWSVAHLWQAILNGEKHVCDITYITTLAGYVHWQLTGEKNLGVGDASGMFPIDSTKNDYDEKMLGQFDTFAKEKNIGWKLRDILPKVEVAGKVAGTLSEKGAKLLDKTGNLISGIKVCAPEGDAGTGMVATNSIAMRTGNVSAGTSIFAMVVLEKALSKVYVEIDMVTTPSGKPVAMVHCNSCTSDIDAWAKLFREATEAFGGSVDTDTLYNTLYKKALEGEQNCGGLLSYNYYSGEPITQTDGGALLFLREPDSNFTLANVMRTHLFSALATLKIGMDILFVKERVQLDILSGHGGFFKTQEVGQRLMAASVNTPVSVLETAGEGGAWGMAILAAYTGTKAEQESLEDYVKNRIFTGSKEKIIKPVAEDLESFNMFMEKYIKGLPLEKAAVEMGVKK